MSIPEITTEDAYKLFKNNEATFIDVRDPGSFSNDHIPGALHINDHNLEEFLKKADRDQRYIVYCYHGNSSLGGTSYFLEEGFKQVESLTGGFTQWALDFPKDKTN